MDTVQDPIIPLVGEWIRASPGTISLGQGIVSYPPPPEVLEAIAHLDPMVHRYQDVQGLVALREIILTKLGSENRISLSGIEQIVVTAGSNMGFMNAILAITQPGDEIILQTPYYFNHEMALRMASCRPILVQTTPSFQLDLEAIAQAITDKTKAIVTISPNNPTGAVYSPADLQRINELCRDRGLFHISDEAYEYFVYGDAIHTSPGQFDRQSEHTISLFSLSKAYGFAGWRIGYMAIPERLQTAIQKIQDTLLICPALISQVAAIEALQVGEQYPKEALIALGKTRHSMIEYLNSIRDHCTYSEPKGAFYFFLKAHTSLSSVDLIQALIQDFKVAVIPGSAFGQLEGCSLRIAYGALAPHTAQAGIERLIQGLQHLCPGRFDGSRKVRRSV
jgi:aspartate/methionine/tyrosine aminotransferase